MKGIKKPHGAKQQLTPVSRSSRQQGEGRLGHTGACVSHLQGQLAAQLRLIPANEACRPGLSDCSREDRRLYATAQFLKFGNQFSFSVCLTNCKEQPTYTSIVGTSSL